MPLKLTTQQFTEKANKKHNFKYDYSLVDYINSNTKIEIICPLHGKFEQLPSNHLSGMECMACGYIRVSNGRLSNKAQFIERSKVRHGDTYTYNNVVYQNSNKIPVLITCQFHGDFLQRPDSHISGRGCPKCKLEYNGYTKTGWITKANGKQGTFYVIKCWNGTEKFYKIGITFNGVKKRYKTKAEMPYKWEIVREIKSFDLDYLWKLEVENKRKLRQFKYKPLIYFGGETECFYSISGITHSKGKEQVLKELKTDKEREEFLEQCIMLNKLIERLTRKNVNEEVNIPSKEEIDFIN